MARILLSSGRGPLECELAVGLYLQFFLARHPDATILREERSRSVIAGGERLTGYSSVLLEVADAEGMRTGTVRWVCQSPVRGSHRRKNWFIEVIRLTEDALPAQIDAAEFDAAAPDKRHFAVETFRSPGKGGQNVNKVETGVRITHILTGMTAESVTARTQAANRKLAFERLREKMLAHNAERHHHMRKAEWTNHDRLERGNAFAVFEGLDFVPVE